MVSLGRINCDDNYFKTSMTLSFQVPANSLFVTFPISFNSAASVAHTASPFKLQSTVPIVFRVPVEFCFIQNTQPLSGAQPASYSVISRSKEAGA